MKKIVCLALALLMGCLLVLPAMATQEGPQITLQPQSPNFPNYSVAIYTVKAEGTNLMATWYMEWLGKTYTISDIGGVMQDWEPYAGEAYGAKKLDDHTFAFFFEGIEKDLDGAYIWCVIEDGHYDVTSQKARIFVGNTSTPPEILQIPTQLTVEQGAEAEIRCVAKSPDGAQLSFLWYETDTGRMEDIRAVNRGTETSDYLLCDTSSLGIRNYICMVETSDGGLAYSSLVPVTVVEKAAVPQAPAQPQPETTPAEEPTTGQPQPAPAPATEPVAAPAPTQTVEDTTAPAETIPDTTAPTQDGSSDTSVPTKTTDPTEVPTQDREDPTPKSGGVPWWVLILIGVGAAGIGAATAIVLIQKKS